VREAVYLTAVIVILRVIFAIALLIHPIPGAGRVFPVGSLLDCLLLAGIAYGVYRMSRVCAILLLAYFVADQIVKFVSQRGAEGGVADVFLVIGALVLSLRAIFFSFRYHALIKGDRTNAAAAQVQNETLTG